MDDDTIDETGDDAVETLLDRAALDVGDDTVVTSAVPPAHDDSPWPELTRRIRSVVYSTAGAIGQRATSAPVHHS